MPLYGNILLPGHPSPENVRRLDLLPIHQIRRMQQVGIAIDVQWLGDLGLRLEARKQDLRKEIASYIPPDALEDFVSSSTDDLGLNVESAEQIAKLLYEKLRVGLGRDLKRTKGGTRISTGKKQLETLKRDHPVIPKILRYREASKLLSTYCVGLPKRARWDAKEERWILHTTILTTRTDTGRLASKNPNLQNIPTRTKEGAQVRKAFVARRGKLLVSWDYAQIELRLMAHDAVEPKMIQIFIDGGDIHISTACDTFNLDYKYYLGLSKKKDAGTLSKEEKQEWSAFNLGQRAPSKNTNFAVGYGITPPGLYDLMALTYATANVDLPDWLTIEWCAQFIVRWFGNYDKMREYFSLQDYRATRYGITWCMFGGVRRIPEMQSCHPRIRAAGLRQAGNNPIQRGAAGVMKIGMARAEDRVLQVARDRGIYAEALLPIHDELLMEVDEKWAEEVGEMAGQEMASATRDIDTGENVLRVPILTDGKVMERDESGESRWAKE